MKLMKRMRKDLMRKTNVTTKSALKPFNKVVNLKMTKMTMLQVSIVIKCLISCDTHSY